MGKVAESLTNRDARGLIRWKVLGERFGSVAGLGCGCGGCAVIAALFAGIGAVGLYGAQAGQAYPELRQTLVTVFLVALLLIFLGGVGRLIVAMAYNRQRRSCLRSKDREETIVNSLIREVQDRRYGDYGAAISVLGDIGNRLAAPSIVAALENGKAEVRRKSVEALMKLGDNSAIEPLIAVLEDRVEEIRYKAAEALERLGWNPTNDAEKAHYLIAKGQWDEVAGLGEPVVDHLSKMLEDESSKVRKRSIEALAKIGNKRAADAIAKVLKDDDRGVKEAAEKALKKVRRGPA